MTLSIVMTPLSGGTVEIAPRGEVDVDCAHEVREAVAVAISRHRPSTIELNMRLVTFIDSVGISAMVAGFQTAEVSGVRLTVTEPSRFVHRQLWVTGLLGLFGAPQPYHPDGDRDARPAASGDIDG